MARTTVYTSQLVPLFLLYARGRGANVDELIVRLGLPADAASRGEIVVAMSVLNETLDALAAELGDPFLGIHVAVEYRRGTYQLYEFCARNAPDVRGGAMRLVRYASMLNHLVRFTFAETDAGAALEHELEGLGRHANEFIMALILLAGREMSGRNWAPLSVWFHHDKPADTNALEELFGTSAITFGRPTNGFVISPEVLELPVRTADDALLRVLETEAARHVAPRPTTAAGDDDVIAEVARAVELALELGPPRIDVVAKALGTSPRTLQRKLTGHGTSLHDVIERTRERLARAYVREAQLTMTQVAFRLGYADAPAFLRAFKRWTGKTPQELRHEPGDRRA